MCRLSWCIRYRVLWGAPPPVGVRYPHFDLTKWPGEIFIQYFGVIAMDYWAEIAIENDCEYFRR